VEEGLCQLGLAEKVQLVEAQVSDKQLSGFYARGAVKALISLCPFCQLQGEHGPALAFIFIKSWAAEAEAEPPEPL
jgi:hypothetical protein